MIIPMLDCGTCDPARYVKGRKEHKTAYPIPRWQSWIALRLARRRRGRFRYARPHFFPSFFRSPPCQCRVSLYTSASCHGETQTLLFAVSLAVPETVPREITGSRACLWLRGKAKICEADPPELASACSSTLACMQPAPLLSIIVSCERRSPCKNMSAVCACRKKNDTVAHGKGGRRARLGE